MSNSIIWLALQNFFHIVGAEVSNYKKVAIIEATPAFIVGSVGIKSGDDTNTCGVCALIKSINEP